MWKLHLDSNRGIRDNEDRTRPAENLNKRLWQQWTWRCDAMRTSFREAERSGIR